VLLVVNVRVEVVAAVDEIVTELGLNAPVVPAGSPLIVKLTVPVNPATGVIVTE
jgi:hypothetical protein